MTGEEAGEVSGSAACAVVASPRGSMLVAAFARRAVGGWTLSLVKADGVPSGDHRLRLAVVRLCSLDALVERAVRRGQAVERFVPAEPTRGDGPHRASEQIAPLLMAQSISDDLYPYQRQGVAWLIRNDRALLGDDMGLGKTAQALSALRRLVRYGRVGWAVVVAPRTLVANWAAEAYRWAPELSVGFALTTGDEREDRWGRMVGRCHVLLTTYEQLRQPPAALVRTPPDLIIADEAHRLRRTESQVSQGFRRLEPKRIWALTGTPIERDAEDLAVLMSILDPVRFSRDDRSLHPTALRTRVRPYVLRRHKDDVLRELPPVIEKVEKLELSPEQRSSYRKAIVEHGPLGPQNALALFGRLRAICDADPTTGESSKLDRVVELLSDIQSVGEKAVVFSYMLDPLRRLQGRLAEQTPAIGHTALIGEMGLDERTAAIDHFRSFGDCLALLASTRVASEGLTLTEANHVIFINRWWNPSANLQARDRVVRIGQARTVLVNSFSCVGTVEERLDSLLRAKTHTFEEIVEALSEAAPDVMGTLLAEE